MLSAWLVEPILGLSDTTRPLVLIGFIVLMFGVAGLAVVLGKRRLDSAQAAALSADTGSDKGAGRGADTTFSDEWLEETRNEAAGEAPQQSWRDAILGPGALRHDDMTDESGVAPPVVAQQQTAWGVGVADETYPAAVQVPTHDAPAVPPVVSPAIITAPRAPFLVDDFLDDEDD